MNVAESRRLALTAQGFASTRPAKPTIRHVRAMAGRLHGIQIDSVNVLARAHYLPGFSRLGNYDMRTLDTLVYDKREMFEYLGHAACFLNMSLYPLLRWRMDRSQYWLSVPERTFTEAVYEEVAARGPISAGELKDPGKRGSGMWNWSRGKWALEGLYGCGRLAIAGRRNFERLYDIAERVIPADVRSAPAVELEEAQKQLLVLASQALGVATRSDLTDYFYLDNPWDRKDERGTLLPARAKRLLGELVEDGRLVQTTVEGWNEPAYVAPGAKAARTVDARSLVSPFDSLMWSRRRIARLFGMQYTIEIYVPAPKRIYGYYVLPFLLGTDLAARVDLKADRQASALLVQSAALERGRDRKPVAASLAAELDAMREWLQLDRVVVTEKGDLAPALRRSVLDVTGRSR